MTIKEITALRKAGQLQEAMEAAENEFRVNQNVFTAGALFWCLNDLSKQQQGEDLQSTFDRMKELCNDYGVGDEYMTSAIERIGGRLLPHANEIKECIASAKNGGDAVSMCNVVSGYYDNGDLDVKLHRDYGWLIYYALRQTELNDAYNRKFLIARYLKLELERPSMLHSLILSEAVKIEKNTPLQFRIRDFIKMWGIENLREEDWKQFTTNDGKTIPSTVEQLISVYAKEMKTDGVVPCEEVCELLDKALPKFPNNQYLPYYKATMLIAQGKKEEATDYYKTLIIANPSKFYLWDQLAELVDDENVAIGLRCKAVTSGTDEEFIVNVRLRLAAMLIAKGLLPNAKHELDMYQKAYEMKGWHLKQAFFDVASRIPSDVVAIDNKDFYAEYSAYAEEYIYSALPSIIAIKESDRMIDDQHRPGRKFLCWKLRADKKTINLRKPQKFGLNGKTPNGKVFEVKELNGKVAWIKPYTGQLECQWIKKVSGSVSKRIDRKVNDFAIIAGVYVGKDLLKGVADGQMITVTAVRQDDGRWVAISKE